MRPIDTSNAKIINDKYNILKLESLSITYADKYGRPGMKICSAFPYDPQYLITQGECCSENMGFIEFENGQLFKQVESSRAKCENPRCETLHPDSNGKNIAKKDDFCLIEAQSNSHDLFPCDGSQNIASQCWSFAHKIEDRKSCVISIMAPDPATPNGCQGLNSYILKLRA